jgi:hypothetical protein
MQNKHDSAAKKVLNVKDDICIHTGGSPYPVARCCVNPTLQLIHFDSTHQQSNIIRKEFRAHLLFHFTFFVASDPINICMPDTVSKNCKCAPAWNLSMQAF